ncbi:MAG TPA: CDP-alcohol phosphatidyltransferase family protein [Myxococcota bacterium]|jgi:phosphatidylglycerophosphate synthase
MAGTMAAAPTNAASVAWLLRRRGAESAKLWGLTPEERLRRTLRAAGCAQIESMEAQDAPPALGPGSLLLLRGDYVFDERLVRALLTTPGALLVSAEGVAVAAHVPAVRAREVAALLATGAAAGATDLRPMTPAQLVPAYTAQLRKLEPAYLFEARPELARAIEARTFTASYKGVTDLVTKWVWPRPAAWATRRLAAWHVHPNTVTVASWVLAGLACWLFAIGAFVPGLLAAWLMTFLDTVDGKLARVTLTSSPFGNVLDHSLDLIHPPFWYLAWAHTLLGSLEWATAVVVGGYFAGRLLEGVFLLAFKMESHCWRPIDSLVRTITARRNPNLIFLSVGALAGRPDLGLVMVALWTLVCFGFHVVRLLQAFQLRRRGGVVEPWDERLKQALGSKLPAAASVQEPA